MQKQSKNYEWKLSISLLLCDLWDWDNWSWVEPKRVFVSKDILSFEGHIIIKAQQRQNTYWAGTSDIFTSSQHQKCWKHICNLEMRQEEERKHETKRKATLLECLCKEGLSKVMSSGELSPTLPHHTLLPETGFLQRNARAARMAALPAGIWHCRAEEAPPSSQSRQQHTAKEHGWWETLPTAVCPVQWNVLHAHWLANRT